MNELPRFTEEMRRRMAPFAGASRREMDRFNRWQDRGCRRSVDRARAWARLERYLRDGLRVHGKKYLI